MYFEEFTVGQVYTTDPYQLSKEEIIAFATNYDPQDMHINEEKAKNGLFKGLIASGIHTMAIATKLSIELGEIHQRAICGIGCDEIKFVQPVYASDVLTVHIEVTECTPHAVKNDRGLVTFSYVVKNQRGVVVLTYRLISLIQCDQSLINA